MQHDNHVRDWRAFHATREGLIVHLGRELSREIHDRQLMHSSSATLVVASLIVDRLLAGGLAPCTIHYALIEPCKKPVYTPLGTCLRQLHDFIKTDDPDAHDAIRDRNGHVVLQECRVCGQAEGDLTPTCPGRPKVSDA